MICNKHFTVSELALEKTESLGTELQRSRNASKQIYRVNVSAQSVDYYCRSVYMPFGDHVSEMADY
jgi:hypothetical protein